MQSILKKFKLGFVRYPQKGWRMSETILELSQLSFAYRQNRVLHDVNLQITRGEFVGIIGPNGAGKSTLLKILAALYPPETGTYRLLGKNLLKWKRKALAKKIGYVPQSVDLTFNFTVRQVIEMGRYPYFQGLTGGDPQAEQYIQQAIEICDLQGLEMRFFPSLSGGEKQRVLIASALAQNTDILLLDEPTASLDLKHQIATLKLLKRLSKKNNRTVVLVTHEINLAAQFCDRLLLLNKGRVVKDGAPDQVLQFTLIQEVYGVNVYIDINPFTQSIYVLPFDLKDEG